MKTLSGKRRTATLLELERKLYELPFETVQCSDGVRTWNVIDIYTDLKERKLLFELEVVKPVGPFKIGQWVRLERIPGAVYRIDDERQRTDWQYSLKSNVPGGWWVSAHELIPCEVKEG